MVRAVAVPAGLNLGKPTHNSHLHLAMSLEFGLILEKQDTEKVSILFVSHLCSLLGLAVVEPGWPGLPPQSRLLSKREIVVQSPGQRFGHCC